MDPTNEYKIIKKKFSKKITICLFNNILSPVSIRDKGIKYDIKPIAWKKKSEIILPLKPKKLLIFLLSENIKLGSSGE